MEKDYSRKHINKIIGNNVRFIRKSNKLSQEKFAELLDLSPQFISDLERGVQGISLTTMVKICNTMKCSPMVILSNLIEFDSYNNEMDDFINLSEKNQQIVKTIISSLLKSQ